MLIHLSKSISLIFHFNGRQNVIRIRQCYQFHVGCEKNDCTLDTNNVLCGTLSDVPSEYTNELDDSWKENVAPNQKRVKFENSKLHCPSQSLEVYWDFGNPESNCSFCGALFWYEERLRKSYRARSPKYGACCNQGKIRIPFLTSPPELLQTLLVGNSDKSVHFRKNIRSYNNMFCFTSLGGRIDHTVNYGGGPPVFRLQGQNYHLIGSLVPPVGEPPKFAQLYIYDTENEVANRRSSVRYEGSGSELDDQLINALKEMLDAHNVLVKAFRMAKERICNEDVPNVSLKLIGTRCADARVYNLPSTSEVAALIVDDFDGSCGERDIIVETSHGEKKRINQLHPSYLPLQYPLLFPYGEDGFREDIPFSNQKPESGGRKKVSIREFFAFRLHERCNEPRTLLFSRRLFQQFVVDAYTMIEASRLNYIRFNQKQLRVEMYKGLPEALLQGDCDASTQGKRVILPSSFTGGARYMVQSYQDAMAICRWIGYPDLFLTFTCNPKWPELIRFFEEGGFNGEDRPDILCRMFKMKLDGLITDLKKRKIFGEIKAAWFTTSPLLLHYYSAKCPTSGVSFLSYILAVIYTIEFQKRGLPHAHILLFLGKKFKRRTAEDLDSIISAEIPDEQLDPLYFQAVSDFMVHGPCGRDRSTSPCMVDGRCSKHFPKKFVEATQIDDDGYVLYRRRDSGRTIMKNGVLLDNRYVVPHNRYLLLKYGAHLNVEWCNQLKAIKYLFKYVNKGNDKVTASFYQLADQTSTEISVDEIKIYYDCRYVSACEAAWRIFAFDIQLKEPTVERLSFHLPNEQSVIFSDSDNINSVLRRESVKQSMFLGWMEANKKYEGARNLTYAEFPQRYVWKPDLREWVPRKQGFSIGRIFFVPPGYGEMYYLRCVLNQVRGATSFRDLRVVDGAECETFQEACYKLGLLNDDKEYVDGITEASEWATAHSLRTLFVTLLLSACMGRPDHVWEECWKHLADDVLYKQRKLLNHPQLQLSDAELKNFALAEIEELLKKQGKSLKDFSCLPFPNLESISLTSNRFVYDEMCYDRAQLHAEFVVLQERLNSEQKNVFTAISDACELYFGKMFFVYGYGGSGKTYVWRTLSAKFRSEGHIVLNVASSGIASLLLPGGRTAHSRFAIPLNLHEDSICNIRHGSTLAELIVRAKLIIWDEAPMMHRYCFEALDRSMRDIMRSIDSRRNDFPFGGKTIVFGGDFRQILPVIPKGSRADIVLATINASYLWRHCKVLRLTENMRLQLIDKDSDVNELREFANWLASIGDGDVGERNDGGNKIEIDRKFLVDTFSDPISGIVGSVYCEYLSGRNDIAYFAERAVLAPTLDTVNMVNDYMVSLNDTIGRSYYSSDLPCHSENDGIIFSELHTPEFLGSLSMSGLPNHVLHLKVGTPVMLLRNIDPSIGLCNGTRLVITRLGNHVLEAEVLSVDNGGVKVLIPRMSLSPSDSRIPFRFERRQFPLIVSYAMTINKSQGQSLSVVGLILRKPVFSHGQLYVALSRVKHPSGLKILICDDDEATFSSNVTPNVVFKEVFNNI